MSPEYIEQLADKADPDQLWLTPVLKQKDLPEAQRHQLDTGIALRRYASLVRHLNGLIGTDKSLLITPIARLSTISKVVPTPDDHQQRRSAERAPTFSYSRAACPGCGYLIDNILVQYTRGNPLCPRCGKHSIGEFNYIAP